MKCLAITLALLALTHTTQAAPRIACRNTSAVRVSHARIAATSHAAASKFVITAFAVPVAVLVAPFAPYWYGITDYQHHSLPSLRGSRGSASQRAAREAPPRAQNPDAEPRSNVLQSDAPQPQTNDTSLVITKCTACHGRTSPKVGLSLVDVPALSADDRLRALRAVLDRKMPPEGEDPLNDDDRDAILRELAGD